MVNDDAEGHDGAAYVPTGARRSTFTPPSDSPVEAADQAIAYDDDDLATALADQMTRFTPSAPPAQPVATPFAPQTDAAPAVQPLADLPAPSGPPVVVEGGGAVDPTTGLPQPPRRRSLSDRELARTLEETSSAGTLDAIDKLQSELSLREQEIEEYGAWERTMLDIGTPEAQRAVSEARETFTGVIPVVTGTGSMPVKAAQPHDSVAPEPPHGHAPADQVPFDFPTFSDSQSPGGAQGGTSSFDSISDETTERPHRPPIIDDVVFEEPTANALAAAAAPVIWDLVEPDVVGPPPTGEVDEPASAQNAPAELSLGGFDAMIAARSTQSPAQPEVAPTPIEHDSSLSDSADGPLFVEPVGFIDTDFGPVQTGSVQVISPEIEPEPLDDVDETDRAFEDLLGPFPVTSEGETILPPVTGSAPLQPMSSPRVADDELVLHGEEPKAQPVFSLEAAGAESTQLDHRVGRSARLFWLWFATNASIISVAFGAVLFSLGMSLRQAVLAALIGVAISFLPLGLGTLASKWSGQPTMVVSRATFGLVGNGIPAVLAIVTRLFWGAVLLWVIGASTARILVGARLNGQFTELQLTLGVMAIGFALALVIAIFGYHLFARVQLVLSIVSGVLIVALVVVTWPAVNISAALSVGDGPWMLVVTGAVLVFSFVGLIWATSSGDLARYQRTSSSGAAAMLWAPFGATLPAFILIAYGALLAASSPSTAEGLLETPIDSIALLLPVWYPVPLIAAISLSLLSGVVLSMYSGGFALRALGVAAPRHWGSIIIGILIVGSAVLLAFSVDSIVPIFRDFATTLAVPVAAWAGIFAAEMIIRRKVFDQESLLARGSVYPAVRWGNLLMLCVAAAVGFGFTAATVGWLSWQGYLFPLLGVQDDSVLVGTDLGVLVALLIGILTPLIAGVPAVRKQERLQSEQRTL